MALAGRAEKLTLSLGYTMRRFFFSITLPMLLVAAIQVNIDFLWTGAAIIHTNRVQCNVFGPPLNTATELTDSPVHVAVNELPISCIV